MIRDVAQTDFRSVNEWRKRRGAPMLPVDFYPPIGLIEPGVACGFLLLTDSKIALLENFVTNPDSPKRLRYKSIKDIGMKLEKIAKKREYKYLMSITKYTGIRKVCDRIGYEFLGRTMLLGKEL